MPTRVGRPFDPCATILLLVWLTILAVLPSILPAGCATASSAPAPAVVNPNSAPWWELTVLPRIGQTTAHEIVRYRESVRQSATCGNGAPAFRCAADMVQVRGIGPVTLQRIGPYLDF